MLVIWYVDAGNTSHSTLSNHLSLLRADLCPNPGACRYYNAGHAQKAQQSSDIANKNQPVLVSALSLTLLVSWISITDNTDNTLATDHLAVPANFLY